MLILAALLKAFESPNGGEKLGAILRAATNDDLAELILDIEELQRPSKDELDIKEEAGKQMLKAMTKGAPQRRQMGTNEELWACPEDPGPDLTPKPTLIPVLTPEPPKPY